MTTKLYVGNLSYDVTEDAILQAFSQDSRQVSSVNLVTDRDTGRPRGFAFVEMATEDDARAAIEALNGTALEGRAMRVDKAQARPSGGAARGGRRGW